jgi:ABC-type enterobactin transport system permease subunit
MHVTLDDGRTVAVQGAVAAMIGRLVTSQAVLARFGRYGHYQVRLHVTGETVKAQLVTVLEGDTVQ